MTAKDVIRVAHNISHLQPDDVPLRQLLLQSIMLNVLSEAEDRGEDGMHRDELFRVADATFRSMMDRPGVPT